MLFLLPLVRASINIDEFADSLKPQYPVTNQTFAVGYSSCEDVNVLATELIPKLISTYKLEDVAPKYHSSLSDVRSVVESFLFQFKHGANAELRVESKVFSEMVKIARIIPDARVFPGGNAYCMVHRISKEYSGHVVKLGAQVSAKIKEKLEKHNVQILQNEDVPPEQTDVHLALEYRAGDTIAGLTATRSNRYYMNSDIHNAKLTAAEKLHKNLMPTDIFVITGLQILQSSKEPSIALVSEALKKHPGGSHFESGAYENHDVFEALWKAGLFHNVRSLGVNEQELAFLYHVLKTGDPKSVAHASNSTPDANWALTTTIDTLERLRQSKSLVSRIHMHAFGYHALCYDPKFWGSGLDSIGATSRVASQLTCGDAWEKRDWGKFTPPGEGNGAGIVYDAYHAHNRCQTIRDYVCCVAPVLICKVAIRTAGVGDNMSGAGLAYHTYIGDVSKAHDEL